MVPHLTSRQPSDVQENLTRLLKIEDGEMKFTVNLYAPLRGTFTLQDAQHDTFGQKFLEPLYDSWCRSIRDATLPFPNPADLVLKPHIQVLLDTTHPAKAINFMLYEARGLLRITALLNQKLRDLGTLQATLVGPQC